MDNATQNKENKNKNLVGKDKGIKKSFKKRKTIKVEKKKTIKRHSLNKMSLNHNFTKSVSHNIKKVIEVNSKNNKNSKNLSTINNTNNGNNLKRNNILEFNNTELNSLEYAEALKYDKRTFIQYYFSLLKSKHLLLFSFYCRNKDYNSQIIKMFLFFFFFSVHFAVNALFFNDGTLHKIYMDEGDFNFIYQISQIIYSSLISGVLNAIINYVALSEDQVLKIKSIKKLEEFNSEVKMVFRTLKIKFALFFIISFLLLFIFMYYITCFCGVYTNTQIHLIKDAIISFGLSLIYPFGIYLIPGIFRIYSLRAEKKNKKCIYKFSTIIQSL